ncbi:hypothetical protein pb186bvf_012021 [Paramecium bursaria]
MFFILFQYVVAQITNLPVLMSFDQPLSTWITSKDPLNVSSTHNCVIVPCTVVDFQQNCMQIVKKTNGGDCYTQYFPNQLNYSDPNNNTDVYTVEIAYFPIKQPQDKTGRSGLVIGYQARNQSGITWVLGENQDIVLQNDNQTTKYFVQLNSQVSFSWQIIRFHVRPDPQYQLQDIRLVFEAYDAMTDFAGQFLLSNISIFHRGSCSDNCLTCQSYQLCTSCNDSKLYRGACLNDYCYADSTQLSYQQVNIGWVSQTLSLYGIQIKGVNITCFDVYFSVGGTNLTYQNGSSNGIQQYSYKITLAFLQSWCSFGSNLTDSKNITGYQCDFEFRYYAKNTSIIMYDFPWTQVFSYNQNPVVENQIDSQQFNSLKLTNIQDAGSVTITINGTVKICKISNCRIIEENSVLYLNQEFYVLVSLSENSWGFAEDFWFELQSAMVFSNGTAFALPQTAPKREKNMTAMIFTFRVPIVVNNASLQIAAYLVERPIDSSTQTSSGRRLLTSRLLQSASNQGPSSSSGYSVGAQTRIEILPGVPADTPELQAVVIIYQVYWEDVCAAVRLNRAIQYQLITKLLAQLNEEEEEDLKQRFDKG